MHEVHADVFPVPFPALDPSRDASRDPAAGGGAGGGGAAWIPARPMMVCHLLPRALAAGGVDTRACCEAVDAGAVREVARATIAQAAGGEAGAAAGAGAGAAVAPCARLAADADFGLVFLGTGCAMPTKCARARASAPPVARAHPSPPP